MTRVTRESHVCCTYPGGRYVVATTTHSGLAVALAKAVLELLDERRAA